MYQCVMLDSKPALVVSLVSSWDGQTLIHVSMEKPQHVAASQKPWRQRVLLQGQCGTVHHVHQIETTRQDEHRPSASSHPDITGVMVHRVCMKEASTIRSPLA